MIGKEEPSKEERIVIGILKWTLLYPAMVAVIGSIYFGAYNRFFNEDRFYVPITDNRPVETLKSSDTASTRVAINGESVYYFKDGRGWIKFNEETGYFEFEYWGPVYDKRTKTE